MLPQIAVWQFQVRRAQTHAGMQLSKGAACAFILLAMTYCGRTRYVLEVERQSPPLAAPHLQPGMHEPVPGHALPHIVLREPPAATRNISKQRNFKLSTILRLDVPSDLVSPQWPDMDICSSGRPELKLQSG